MITTAASAESGRSRTSPGTATSMTAMAPAPTSPVSCDRDPACSATGVRDELLLTGKPWNTPAATLAAPSAIISWFGSTSSPWRRANVRDSTLVSANETSAMPTAPTASFPRSPASTDGNENDGKPRGSSPTTDTSRRAARSNTATTTVAPTTHTSTPGTRFAHRLQARITAIPARPMARAVRLVSPSATPSTKARVPSMTPSASTENPNSLGSWLTITTSAIPFM